MVVRKKALSVLATKSPQQTPTSEQKKHANKVTTKKIFIA